MTDTAVEAPVTVNIAEALPTPAESALGLSRRRPASFQDLIKKKMRESEVVISTQDENGNAMELVVRYRAISSKDYDDLVAKHKPTPTQRDQGQQYNPDTFAPALISSVAISPSLTLEQAQELYVSPQWSSGEMGGLFFEAVKICNAGLDVPFTATG